MKILKFTCEVIEAIIDDLLKEECQRKFEKEHSREEFISIFKKSYL